MTCSTSCSTRTRSALALAALLVASSCSSPGGTSASAAAGVTQPGMGSVSRIAVFPVDNLTGKLAPVDVVGRALQAILSDRGVQLVGDEEMAAFMRKHRVRYIAGVDSRVARELKEETGAGALLITSLELYQEGDEPRVAMFSRLVSTGERPRILWVDGVGMSGDEFPGLLGIGRIEIADLLLERATECIAGSLVETLPHVTELRDSGAREGANDCGPRGKVDFRMEDETVRRRYRPEMVYRSPAIDPDRRYTVAIVPFVNLSDRKDAGEIIATHFVDQMSRNGMLRVVEPGIVREQLLKYRIIMQAGPSFENAKVLADDESAGVDLVFSGSVFDYQDGIGVPKVDFSVTLIEKDGLRVVWSSRSHATGEDGVFFFGQTRVRTAHRLAAELARGTVEVLSR